MRIVSTHCDDDNETHVALTAHITRPQGKADCERAPTKLTRPRLPATEGPPCPVTARASGTALRGACLSHPVYSRHSAMGLGYSLFDLCTAAHRSPEKSGLLRARCYRHQDAAAKVNGMRELAGWQQCTERACMVP